MGFIPLPVRLTNRHNRDTGVWSTMETKRSLGGFTSACRSAMALVFYGCGAVTRYSIGDGDVFFSRHSSTWSDIYCLYASITDGCASGR